MVVEGGGVKRDLDSSAWWMLMPRAQALIKVFAWVGV